MRYVPYKEPTNDKEHEKLYDLIHGEHLCLVCGEAMLESCYFEICPVCGWEDNMVQDMMPDLIGGCNPVSLNQARKAWIEERRGYPWKKEQIANGASEDDFNDDD